MKFLKNKNLKSIINAESNAVKNIFKLKNIPFRQFTFKKGNEEETTTVDESSTTKNARGPAAAARRAALAARGNGAPLDGHRRGRPQRLVCWERLVARRRRPSKRPAAHGPPARAPRRIPRDRAPRARAQRSRRAQSPLGSYWQTDCCSFLQRHYLLHTTQPCPQLCSCSPVVLCLTEKRVLDIWRK